MVSASDALWEINNEYRKRLSLLMGHMKLLEQILKMQGSAEPALRAAIRRIRATLETIDADHHEWRHTYFYRMPKDEDRRRMVSDPQAVLLALRTFSEMFAEHAGLLGTIQSTMADLPRPDPSLTKVIQGNDLWEMCLDGVATLTSYEDFFNHQVAGQPI